MRRLGMEFMKQRKAYDVGIIIFTVLCLSLIPNAKAGAAAGIKICAANFPDKNIRKIADNADVNGNGYLSASERKKVKRIDLGNWSEREKTDISSFKGIEHFTSIKTFYYYGKNTGEDILDLSKNKKLENVSIEGNKGLKSIVLKNLKKLTVVDVREAKKLQKVRIDGSTSVKSFRLEDCPKVSSIDISGLTELDDLALWNCGVKKLDLSKNKKLRKIGLVNLPITSLNVTYSKELYDVSVEECALLKKLKVGESYQVSLRSNEKLSSLSIERATALWDSQNNALSGYGLKQPEYLEHFEYSGDKTELDVSKYTSLSYLDIKHTDIKSIDLSNTMISEKSIKEGKAVIECFDDVKVTYASDPVVMS